MTSQNRAAFLSKEAIEKYIEAQPTNYFLCSRVRLNLIFLFQFREVRLFHVRSNEPQWFWPHCASTNVRVIGGRFSWQYCVLCEMDKGLCKFTVIAAAPSFFERHVCLPALVG